MRLLYLHDGNYDVVSIALKKGYEVVAFNISDFNYSWYPVNYFDILWVNLSYKISAFLNTEHIDYVVDEILYFYELKHWIIEFPDERIHNDICMWGVPFVVINKLSNGKIKKMRIYNNVFKWEPKEDDIYITHKQIVKEILYNIII